MDSFAKMKIFSIPDRTKKKTIQYLRVPCFFTTLFALVMENVDTVFEQTSSESFLFLYQSENVYAEQLAERLSPVLKWNPKVKLSDVFQFQRKLHTRARIITSKPFPHRRHRVTTFYSLDNLNIHLFYFYKCTSFAYLLPFIF